MRADMDANLSAMRTDISTVFATIKKGKDEKNEAEEASSNTKKKRAKEKLKKEDERKKRRVEE